MHKFTKAAAVFSLAAMLGAPAHATPVIEAATGLNNPKFLINFESQTNFDPITIAIQGVTFSSFYVTDQFTNGRASPYAGISGQVAVNFAPPRGTAAQSATISFATTQSDVLFFFAFGGNDRLQIASYLGDTPVEQITDVLSTTNGGYYGFTNSAFDSIRIFSADQNPAFIIDNLQGGQASLSVPEPASAAMLLLGLTGLVAAGAVRRR